MKKIIIAITIVMIFSVLHAGKYAGDFLSIGQGVEALGMGSAFVGKADNCSAIYWNAAGLSQIRKNEVSLMMSILYEGLATYNSITFAKPLPNDVTIATSWKRLEIDDIPVFSESHMTNTTLDQRLTFYWLELPGTPDDYFKSIDDVFQFAFSKHINHDLNFGWSFFKLPADFHFGGNVKYIKRKLHENIGSGVGFDFSFLIKTDMGILLDIDWLGKLIYGVNFQDIGGTVIGWDTASEHEDEILMNTKSGIAIVQPLPFIKSEITFVYDFDYVYDTEKHYGLEYNYNDAVFFRIGSNDSNFSTGAGVRLSKVEINYALIANNLGNTNRVNLQIFF